jgi:phage terminase small subunit
MGLPKNLTERQQKFAELLVYNEGRKSPSECAYEAGYKTRPRQAASELRNPKIAYKTRPRQAASELRNPKIAPLVVKYIGELRAEIQEKYGINFEKHISELAKLREDARAKGAWSAAINAEIARGKAGGLYVDQKLVLSGNLDNMSEKELESKMKQILDDHKTLINITPEEEIKESVIESNLDSDSIQK